MFSEDIAAWLWFGELYVGFAFNFCHLPDAGPWANYSSLVSYFVRMTAAKQYC